MKTQSEQSLYTYDVNNDVKSDLVHTQDFRGVPHDLISNTSRHSSVLQATASMNKAHYQHLLDWFSASKDLFLVIDAGAQVIVANQAANSLLANDHSQIDHLNWISLGAANDNTDALDVLERARSTGTAVYFQQRIKLSQEQHLWVDWSIVFKDDVYMLIGRDVSEAVQAQSELKLADRVMQDCREGIVIINARRKIIRVNRAFTRLTGFSLAEVFDRGLKHVSAGDMDGMRYRQMWQAIRKTGG